MEYKNYNEVPWYRKNGTNVLFMILGLVFVPFIWAVAGMLLTGNVFYDKVDCDGNLKKWSKANKVAAGIVFIVVTYYWVTRLLFA